MAHEVPKEEIVEEEQNSEVCDSVNNVIQEVVEDIQKEELQTQTVFISVKEMIQLYEKQVENLCVPFVEQSVMIEPKYNIYVNNNVDTVKVVEAVEQVVDEFAQPIESQVDVPIARFQNIRRFLPRRGVF